MSSDSQTPAFGKVRLRSPAKVNLHLEVLHRREDGYHEVETILQAVSIWDDLQFGLWDRWDRRSPVIELLVEPTGAAPEDSTNLVWRAIALFCERTGIPDVSVANCARPFPAGRSGRRQRNAAAA